MSFRWVKIRGLCPLEPPILAGRQRGRLICPKKAIGYYAA
ncbi:hypothetical protein CAAU_2227 [Caloramator australicus RC3]|uniref:Uncharacterized protein n=1 Tax=Caloramator australicus RC3 TaxID=857293 RepID=I7LHU0_9CLOT|nr:hypothetical protein CAAU_2227 [Caloramator australicus RC3]